MRAPRRSGGRVLEGRREQVLAQRGGGESGGEGEGEVGAGDDDVATGGEVARLPGPRRHRREATEEPGPRVAATRCDRRTTARTGSTPRTNAPTTLMASVGQGNSVSGAAMSTRWRSTAPTAPPAATSRTSMARIGRCVTRPGSWTTTPSPGCRPTAVRTHRRAGGPARRAASCAARAGAACGPCDSSRSARQNASATSNISVMVTKMGPASRTIGNATSTRGSPRALRLEDLVAEGVGELPLEVGEHRRAGRRRAGSRTGARATAGAARGAARGTAA